MRAIKSKDGTLDITCWPSSYDRSIKLISIMPWGLRTFIWLGDKKGEQIGILSGQETLRCLAETILKVLPKKKS